MKCVNADNIVIKLLLLFVVLLLTFGVFLPINKVSAVGANPVWSTFLGGSGTDSFLSIKTDSAGNMYVTGASTATWGSPIRAYSAGTDGYVAKLDNNGNLLWNTFFGAAGTDEARSLTFDSEGNIYVTGISAATWGSPLRAFGTGNEAYVAKLTADGTILWSTFIGGGGSDSGYSIAVSNSGDIYVTGVSDATWGTPVRAYTSGQDVSLFKLNSSGTLVWNTFLGGASSTENPSRTSIFLDGSGAVYVGGGTSGTSWGTPVRPFSSGFDMFVAKVNGDGTLLWNTFLGGTGSDYIRGMAFDNDGNSYLVGESTVSWGSPVRAFTSGIFDAVVIKVDSSGNLLWNTFLGGSSDDSALGIAISSNGNNIYVSGASNGTWGSPIHSYLAGYDATVVRLDGTGALLWNTFFGGNGDDTTAGGKGGISMDNLGNVYVGGYSPSAWGTPVRAYTAGTDTFVTKFDDGVPTTTDDVGSTWHNTDATVTLQCTDNTRGSGCGSTYYTTDGSTPTTSSSSGTSFTLSTEGEYTIKYFSVDNSNNTEAVKTAINTVKIDKTAPTGALQITSQLTGGKTKTRNITLGVTADGTGSTVTDMMLSENVLLTGASWESFAASRAFTLSAGDGTKTVYAKVRDAAGNESAIFSISVTLLTKTATMSPATTQSTGAVVVTPTPTETIVPTETPTPTIILIGVQLKDQNGNILRNTTVYINGQKYTTDANGKIYLQDTVAQSAKVEVEVNGKKYSGSVLGGTIVADLTSQTVQKKVSYTWLWWILALAVVTALLYTYGKSKTK